MNKQEIVEYLEEFFRGDVQLFTETREEIPKAIYVTPGKVDIGYLDRHFFDSEATKAMLTKLLHVRFRSLPQVEAVALIVFTWAYAFPVTPEGLARKEFAERLRLSNTQAWKMGLCERKELVFCSIEGPGWDHQFGQFYHTRSDGAIILKEFATNEMLQMSSRFGGFFKNCDTDKHGQSNAHSA